MKMLEKIALGMLVVVLLLVILAVVLKNAVLVDVSFILLAVTSIAYTIPQIGQYLSMMGDNTKESKTQLVIMIVSTVVALAVIVLSILVVADKMAFLMN